jgi:hypothetical protein
MSNLTKEQQIAAYLADYSTDPNKLYQEWYLTLTPSDKDPEIIRFGKTASLAELKQRFHTWFEEKRHLLRQTVCQQYRLEKKQLRKSELIIAAIAVDGLAISLSLPTTNLIMTTTILVADGYLDRLCQESSP